MSKPTLTRLADMGAVRKVKPSVHQTKFGDGYEARVPIGINSTPGAWNVKFSVPGVEVLAFLSFLEGLGGVKSFLWTDPLGALGTYVCREWTSVQIPFGLYEVSGTFDQVYEP